MRKKIHHLPIVTCMRFYAYSARAKEKQLPANGVIKIICTKKNVLICFFSLLCPS